MGSWPAMAQGELIKVDASGPVYIKADQVAYDEVKLTYEAQGQVEVRRGSTVLIADEVVVDKTSLVAEAQGKVRLAQPGYVLTGQRLVVDLNSGTGKLYDGQVFIESSNYYIRGAQIAKTGKRTYTATDCQFTTCDGDSPAWWLDADEVDVTVEGYGKAKNATFRAGGVPLFYTPYMLFPAKFKRQSGLLAPQFGNSTRDGWVFSLPWFQTLGEDQDLTFTLTQRTKRGLDLGLEYRYHLAPGSKGMFMVDYMPTDDAAEELHKEGELAEAYSSRAWFRGKADQYLFQDTTRVTLDLDWVSDRDYLREFTFGYTGFTLTDARFNKWFGRGLEPETSLFRKNRINLQRSWRTASFNADFLYWDDLNDNDQRTLQELPTLSYNAVRQPVGETGLYFQMDSIYHYYWREEGSTGHIADLAPAVSLPLNFNEYLLLEPKITVKPRLYSVTLDPGEDPEHEKQGFDYLWSFGLGSSTYMFRVFDLGSAEDPFKIKHAMRPFVNYFYQPELGDDDTADLARRGQGRSNNFSYGVNNSFTYKLLEEDEVTGDMVPVYQEFLRVNLAHSFDLNTYRADRDARYWGEFTGRLELEPNEYLYLQTFASWNLYDNRFSEITARLVARDKRGDRITMDYINTYGVTNQINTELELAITTEWSLGYINRKDIIEDIDFEQTYQLKYEGQCWGIKFFYTDRHFHEQGYWVVFSLGGIGELFGYGRTQSEAPEDN